MSLICIMLDLSPLLLEGVQAADKCLHFTLFFAVLYRSLQLRQPSDISASTLLLQLFLGRPCFLFPWGFHFRACRVMSLVGFLRVWPIQLHFLFRISTSMGSWLVLSQWSTLLTLTLHQMCKMLLRHVLVNVCSLCVVCFVS